MNIKKMLFFSLTFLTPITTFVACSSGNNAVISLKNFQFISKTKEDTTIKISIENLSKDIKENDITLYIADKNDISVTILTKVTKIEEDNVTFQFKNLIPSTTYKLLKIEVKNQILIVQNIEFMVKSEKIAQPTEPETETPNPQPETPKLPIKPTSPSNDANPEKAIFTVSIIPEASNKYASDFLLSSDINNNDFKLNKEYFEISNNLSIAEKDISIIASSFDDISGKLSIKVQAGDKVNNFDFVLNANLLELENKPLKIWTTKNKTADYEIASGKTDSQRASDLKALLNNNSDDNNLRNLIDYRIGYSKDDIFSYPYVYVNSIRNIEVSENSSKIFDDMEIFFDYNITVETLSLEKGTTKITKSFPKNKNNNSLFNKQQLQLPFIKIVKSYFDSITIDETYMKTINKLFPSFLYALDKSQGESQRIELSEDDENYSSYETTNHSSLAAGITNVDLYINAINTLLTSKYNKNIVEWFKRKNIDMKYNIASNEYSDVKGDFTLTISAESTSSTSLLNKKLKINGFRKISNSVDFGENKNGFYVQFNDDQRRKSLSDEDEKGFNWNGIITTLINPKIAKITSSGNWVNITEPKNDKILEELNDSTKQRNYFQFKYNDFLLNLYNREKWPFPIDWANNYEIEITQVDYNANDKRLRFHYLLKLNVIDNGSAVEYTKIGTSSATILEKTDDSGVKKWKILAISTP